jgi:hypothetical protein
MAMIASNACKNSIDMSSMCFPSPLLFDAILPTKRPGVFELCH